MNLASVNIENTGGLLRGGSLNLTALNDIANNSGFLQGGDISLKAGGNIVSQTLTRPDAGNAAHQHVLAQGGIEATGTVTAVAGNDLAIRGSTLSAGGDVTLAAGRDMTVGTVTEEFHLDGGSRSWEHRVTHTGSTVAAGGNLNMTAGRDMTVAGSQVGAGGDAQLAAGGDLSVVAVQDTFSSFVKAESGKGGLFSSSSKSTYTQDYRTSKSSTVAAGGNLSLLAGVSGLTPGASTQTGHASVVGSNLVSGKDLTVAASGNVNVSSAQNSSYFSHTKSTVGALGLSSSSKREEKSSVTQVGSTLSGENVKISAGNDITATASNIFAAQNVQLNAAKGNILLDAAQNTQSSYYKSSSSRAGIFGGSSGISFASSKQKQKGAGVGKNIGSAIMAGEDITMTAQNDVTSVGSLISAGNNVQIQSGRDVNLLPGNDTSYAFESSKKSEVGIGAALSSSGASLSLGYQSTAKGSKQNAAQNAGSLVQAGNDISITTGRDINQIASHIEAARDVNLNTGRDWNMLAGQDSQSASAWRKDVQAGIALSLQQNVSSAVQAVADLPQAMGSGQGGLGYQGVTAASAGLKAVTSVYNSIFQVVSASLSVGGSTSQQKSSSSSSTA
ncbi:hemagglutinin repeat-containing protein, partial [Desulfovibrio sp. 6_1_46AFAA]|uniref:hemagglutinin repeat-containing protein n=1 Tax=Desulfovibrio sp. 6_1_46AFAA TaxID=665942 RepID=UPI0018DAFF6B